VVSIYSVNSLTIPNPTATLKQEINLTRYWEGNLSTYHVFEPGAYTVLGGDAWGTTLLLHFTVR
jgi:hypothetical protein